MAGLTKDRRASTRLALRYFADKGVREEFVARGVPLDAPLVVCEWDSAMSEVMDMLQKTPGPSAIVIIRRGEEMQALYAEFGAETPGEWSLSSNNVHPNSHIGHVYEALLPRKKWDISRGMISESTPMSVGGLSFSTLA